MNLDKVLLKIEMLKVEIKAEKDRLVASIASRLVKLYLTMVASLNALVAMWAILINNSNQTRFTLKLKLAPDLFKSIRP